MAGYKVISDIDKLLQAKLWNGIAGDPALTPEHVPNAESIFLTSPAENGVANERSVSLWLYQARVAGAVQFAPPTGSRPPFLLDLVYVITPFTGSPEGDHLVVGRILQIFHDSPVLQLDGAPLTVAFAQQELTAAWEALRQPIRLSLCCIVRGVQIEQAGG
jgi:Pvc16 N-terminal domain